jgi:hypothetical protein
MQGERFELSMTYVTGYLSAKAIKKSLNIDTPKPCPLTKLGHPCFNYSKYKYT